MLRDTSNNSSKHPKEVTNCLRHIIHGVIYRVEVAPADEAKPKKRRELCMTRKAIKAREKRRRLKEAKEKEKELSQIYNPVVVTQYLTEDGSNAVQEAAEEPIKPSPLLQLQQQQVNGNDDNDDANKPPDTQAQQEQEDSLADENEMSGLIKPEDNNAVAVAADNSSFYSFLTKTDDRDDSAAQSQPTQEGGTPKDAVATKSEGISNSEGNPNAHVKSDDNTRIPEAIDTKEAHEE